MLYLTSKVYATFTNIELKQAGMSKILITKIKQFLINRRVLVDFERIEPKLPFGDYTNDELIEELKHRGLKIEVNYE